MSEETKPESCWWSQDGEDSDLWQTSCRHWFRLDDGPPSDNGMVYCCFCAKPIEDAPWEPEEEVE